MRNGCTSFVILPWSSLDRAVAVAHQLIRWTTPLRSLWVPSLHRVGPLYTLVGGSLPLQNTEKEEGNTYQIVRPCVVELKNEIPTTKRGASGLLVRSVSPVQEFLHLSIGTRVFFQRIHTWQRKIT